GGRPAVGGALAALLCARRVPPRAVAESLVTSVVRAAALSSVDGAAAGVISARAADLAEGVSRAMFTSKLKTATAVLLAVGFLAGACVVTCQALAGKPAAQQQAAVPPQPPAAAPGQGDEAARPPTQEEGGTVRRRLLAPD